MSYGVWQGWGSNPVIVYPIEAIEKLEKELNEYRQMAIKSINEFANSLPIDLEYVIDSKDCVANNKDYIADGKNCIALESNARGIAVNIQSVVIMTQPPRVISPSIVISEVTTQLGALGFSYYGVDKYKNDVYRKTMRFWGNADEFINWLFNSNIRISDRVKDAIKMYSGSIKSAVWVKKVLVRSNDVENEVVYLDQVILRIKRQNNGLLNKLTKLLTVFEKDTGGES